MVRLVDYLQRYGQYLLFALLLIFGTRAFLTDTCAIAAKDHSEWSSQYWRWVADATYRAAQLFVLEFNRDCHDPAIAAEVGWPLEIARYAALLFVAGAVVTFLVPHATRRLLVAIQLLGQGRRAIVLGYGPVGQGLARELATRVRQRPPVHKASHLPIGQRLGHWLLGLRSVAAADRWWRRGRFVTVIHQGITPALAEVARRDNILLVEGDPSNPVLHRRIRIDRSACVFAAVGSDMQTLDAAVSARNSLTRPGHRIRAILSDHDLAANLAEAAPRGFLGAADIRGFSLATEAARLLIAEARFDRTALEKKQDHVHLFIVGCGSQGEAVAMETLLTAWRTDLGPPVISILDRNAEPVRERLKRRAPALFPDARYPALPEPARAQVNVEPCDIERIDFVNHEILDKLLARHGPATAWVFAAGDDSLNLRAAAALHLAILKKRLPPAPIYVRIWSGHQGDTPILSSQPVGLARSFGALEATLAATPACDDDPDQVAEELHHAYLKQGEAMSCADPGFTFTDLPWNELSETMRNANRRLHRHAVMKFEDLGGQWRQRGRAVPVVDAELRDPYVMAEEHMNYDAMETQQLPRRWWKGEGDAPRLEEDELTRRAATLLKVAIAEHNRWTIDRALDGWRPTARPDRTLRDDVRRYHPNMHAWSELDANTRRWDAVLLRTLVAGQKGRDLAVSAWERKVSSVVLATRTIASRPGSNVSRFSTDCRFVASMDHASLDSRPTELHIAIAGEPRRADLKQTVESACAAFDRLLASPAATARLCRIRFDFFEPPGEGMLAIANALGSMAASWKPNAIRGRRIPAEAPIEVSSLWDWSEAAAPVLGFVGHRNLDRLDGSHGLAGFLETFLASRLADGQVSGLVSGYAPGADRIAVDSWIALGAPKPLLFFPFCRHVDGRGSAECRIHLTKADAIEGSPEWVRHDDIAEFATIRTSRSRPGLDAHGSQASDILDNADIIVAVYDGAGRSGSGSVGETVMRASAMGKQVIIIDRDGNGNWRHHDQEDVCEAPSQ